MDKSAKFDLRLTPSERRRWDRAARRTGTDTSTWLRDLAARSAARSEAKAKAQRAERKAQRAVA